MIQSYWRVHIGTNTVPFFIRDQNICEFHYQVSNPGTNLPWTPRDDYRCLVVLEWLKRVRFRDSWSQPSSEAQETGKWTVACGMPPLTTGGKQTVPWNQWDLGGRRTLAAMETEMEKLNYLPRSHSSIRTGWQLKPNSRGLCQGRKQSVTKGCVFSHSVCNPLLLVLRKKEKYSYSSFKSSLKYKLL